MKQLRHQLGMNQKQSELESMVKQWKSQKHEEPKLWSFLVLCHKQIRNARRESKEKSNMKHSRGQQLSATLEHFLELNLCIRYVVSKLSKLEIQCFKRCAIWSWNEGVIAFSYEITRGWLGNGVFPVAKLCRHLARLQKSPECFPIFAIDILRSFLLQIIDV